MVRLVDDLLDVSRITLNKLALRKEVLGLLPVVQSAVEAARPMVDGARQQLEVSLEGNQISHMTHSLLP